MGFIYKITNKVNNDFYIGQTKNSVNRRFNCHMSNALKRNNNNKFYNAISKYGKNNFNIIILEEVSNDKLDEKEIYYILNMKPKYNTSEGGKSTKGFKNKSLTDSHKKSLLESNNIKVFQYDLEGNFIRKFLSLKEAGSEISKHCHRTISHCIRGVQKTACGYFWSTVFLGIRISPIKKERHKVRPIAQLGLDGNIIKIWDAMTDIEKELGISTSKICMCCQGKRKTTKGFKFKYYGDN